MNSKEEKVHIHKVVQMHNCTYDHVRLKYSHCIDDKGIIPYSAINDIRY